MARERFGAAEADRQPEDLQCIEEGERLFLSAFDVEGECRACTGALPGKTVCAFERPRAFEPKVAV